MPVRLRRDLDLRAALTLFWVVLAAASLLYAAIPNVKIVPHIFDPYNTNHGQLQASWVKNPERNVGARSGEVLLLQKATKLSDPGIPYATVNGTEGSRLRELGYDVAVKKGQGFKGAHCGVSPNIEITLTNRTAYSFRCEKGKHAAIPGGIWERVRFRDKYAIPISCSPTPKCQLMPWPGFGNARTVIAAPPDDNPKSFTFLIIMMDGLDYPPDFSGMVYMKNIDVNGLLIRDSGPHPVHAGSPKTANPAASD